MEINPLFEWITSPFGFKIGMWSLGVLGFSLIIKSERERWLGNWLAGSLFWGMLLTLGVLLFSTDTSYEVPGIAWDISLISIMLVILPWFVEKVKVSFYKKTRLIKSIQCVANIGIGIGYTYIAAMMLGFFAATMTWELVQNTLLMMVILAVIFGSSFGIYLVTKKLDLKLFSNDQKEETEK